ncbi:MAG: hypothetical protein ABSE50_25250, partial [Xanthobacteraceae bacterium]
MLKAQILEFDRMIRAWHPAAAYRLLGALPDSKSAFLYLLSAITTYGHSDIAVQSFKRQIEALSIVAKTTHA